MTHILRRSGVDASDLDFGVMLTMSLRTLVVLFRVLRVLRTANYSQGEKARSIRWLRRSGAGSAAGRRLAIIPYRSTGYSGIDFCGSRFRGDRVHLNPARCRGSPLKRLPQG